VVLAAHRRRPPQALPTAAPARLHGERGGRARDRRRAGLGSEDAHPLRVGQIGAHPAAERARVLQARAELP
jgi:hypothetical protein